CPNHYGTTVPVYFPPVHYNASPAGNSLGGFSSCPECFSPGPFVFSPPIVSSPPKNCDPCLLGVGLMAFCIGQMGPAGEAVECSEAAAKCAFGFIKDGISLESGADCLDNIADCAKKSLRKPLKLPKCILPAAACLPPALGGFGIGSGGSASAGLGR